MATILDMLEKVERFDINEAAMEILSELSGDIEEVQKGQLLHGETPEGTKITPDYASPDYEAYKYAMNGLAGLGTPDLRLTGAFYNGVYFRVNGTEWEISSTDSKTEELEEKYRPIFGLQEKKKDSIRELITKKLKEDVEKLLGL